MQTTKPTVAGSSRKRFVKGSWGAHRTLKKDQEPGLRAASLEVQQGKSLKTLAAWGRGGSYCCWSRALITQSRPEETGAVPGTPELNTPPTLLTGRARLAAYGCCLTLIISASTSATTWDWKSAGCILELQLQGLCEAQVLLFQSGWGGRTARSGWVSYLTSCALLHSTTVSFTW